MSDKRTHDSVVDIWRVERRGDLDADGDSQRRCRQHSITATPFAIGEFFQNLTGGGGKADIATIRADGTNLRILTAGRSNHGFPSWSGDGRRIVYREATRERNAILVLDLESGRSRTILEGPAHYNFTTWSHRLSALTGNPA